MRAFTTEQIAPEARTRKRLVATVSRRERACKRTGEPSVIVCGKEEQVEHTRRDDLFHNNLFEGDNNTIEKYYEKTNSINNNSLINIIHNVLFSYIQIQMTFL